jgi:hypothetical protein
MKATLFVLAITGMLAACAQPADTATATATPAAKGFDATSPYSNYELTMERIDAMLVAQSYLAAAVKDDPSLDAAMKAASGEDGVRYAARLEATPALRAAITKAGLSTRDYALTSEALMTALVTQEAITAGRLKAIPNGVNRQNVYFVRENKDALAARFAGYQQR